MHQPAGTVPEIPDTPFSGCKDTEVESSGQYSHENLNFLERTQLDFGRSEDDIERMLMLQKYMDKQMLNQRSSVVHIPEHSEGSCSLPLNNLYWPLSLPNTL